MACKNKSGYRTKQEKYQSCVKKVKAKRQQGTNPYAVCHEAVYRPHHTIDDMVYKL